MARDFRDNRAFHIAHNFPPQLPRAHLTALFLTKLAKHLALLACLMIVGEATGQPPLGPIGIFLLIVFAASLQCASRSLQGRLLYRHPPSRR